MLWTRIKNPLDQWWDHTTQVMQLFVVGGAAVLLSIVLALVHAPDRLVAGLMAAGTLLLFAAFLTDCYLAALRLWETPWGKLLGALLATMVASSSMALSSVIFNAATGMDPANFSYVVAFIAPLTAGYLLTVGTMFVVAGFFVWFVGYTIFGFLLTVVDGKKYAHRMDADKVLIRMVGVVALVMTNAVAVDFGGKSYDSGLASTARGFTYFLEMYAEDPCAREGERVRRISDEIVAFGRWESQRLVFDRRACPAGELAGDQ